MVDEKILNSLSELVFLIFQRSQGNKVDTGKLKAKNRGGYQYRL
jgi:hypothetical protein